MGTAENPIPLFSDQYKSTIVDDDNKELFDSNSDGIVHEYLEDGTRSEYWIIEQDGTFFTTKLPINWIRSTTTTVVNERTKTVTNQVTETIEKQRTETVREQRTATIEKQRTATVEKQRTEIIKSQRTATVEKQRTKTIDTQIVDTQVVDEDYAIDHFDLVLYPFKSYSQIKSNVKDIRKVYDASFSYDASLVNRITDILDDNNSDVKTIAHNFKSPRVASEGTHGDILSINNYLRLNATIATNSKITREEGTLIIDKIKIALANAFNMRELDFGEEIPFDSIVEVIEKADSRIRLASLNEPALYTTFSVLEDIDIDGKPIIYEYAVASDWLTAEEADATNRFSYKDGKGNVISTFDTAEAKKIYNKLAVRNVLAGRVPLFKYNSTFETSFSEGSYQVTEKVTDISELPEKLQKPNSDNPFTIYDSYGTIYTGQYDADTDKTNYTKTYTPDIFKDNVINKIKDNVITNIDTGLKINANNSNISKVTLADGEYVKFRAPNFTTSKTYPAYVNYHLALKTDSKTSAEYAAKYANAYTLFDLLDEDSSEWLSNPNTRWEKALDYFKSLDAQNSTKYVKKFTLTQKISKYNVAAVTDSELCPKAGEDGYHVIDSSSNTCKYCNTPMTSSELKGPIVIEVGGSNSDAEVETADSLLNKSGCVKLLNEFVTIMTEQGPMSGFKATLKWTDEDGDTIPNGAAGPDLPILVTFPNNSPYISSTELLNSIKTSVDGRVELLKSQIIDGKPALPENCAWTISFDFECVPFDAASLNEWDNFIRANGPTIFGFTPIVEKDAVLWRVYGEGYAEGKYILNTGEKLLKFDREYFGNVSEVAGGILHGLYVVEYIGKDAKAAVISNNEEYRLKSGERLFIEYTPSTVAEDGTTQTQSSVTEVLEAGTIIRPSGFESGLVDSTAYTALGNTPHKTVVFETSDSGSVEVGLHRFGANEQVEVRDFAKVTLSKNAFKSKAASAIYVYKNFNGCPELEKANFVNGKRINNVYTLKDGEYIFYTDQNQLELAYFTTGTEITLEGNTVFPEFDIIDLSVIFDSGLSEIPWKYMAFSSDDDKIIFQEYQYITLGLNDTIKNMNLIQQPEALTGEWQYCNNVEYTPSGSTEVLTLPVIDVYEDGLDDKGDGWQASSILALDVSSTTAQVLRKTDQVEATMSLTSTSADGEIDAIGTIDLTEYLKVGYPLSFKTNLACQTNGGTITIDDIYSNPDKLKGFELKIFTIDNPVVVKTEPGKVVPHRTENIVDIANWNGAALASKDSTELWTSVDLSEMQVSKNATDPDRALRLPISLLPNTYGIFCIYLNYTANAVNNNNKTWIELMPGSSRNDITILNVSDDEVMWDTSQTNACSFDRLLLKPGINCLRVNKTCKLFIKSQTQGILYFDELRLVDCKPVEYTINGVTDTMSTYGLNIDQIGYLNNSDTDVVDKTLLNKLMTDCASTVANDLLALGKKTDDSFSSEYASLESVKPKLQVIEEVTAEIKSELDKLIIKCTEDNEPYINALFEKYKYINESISLERSLLNALDENKDLDDLESQLANIIEGFSSIEIEQQQLLAELDVLKDTAISNFDKLTEDNILNDFKLSTADATAKAMSQITDICINKVNEHFTKQLNELVDSMTNVVSSEERTKLLEAFENLKAATTADVKVDLLSKVKMLTLTLDKSNITNLSETITKAALEADYVALSTSLMQLRDTLDVAELQSILAEIETSIDSDLYSHVSKLMTELRTVLDRTEDPIKKGIQDAITTANSNASSNKETVDTALVNKLSTISSNITKLYDDAADVLITDINSLIADLEKGYDYSTCVKAIKNLEASRDTQVAELVARLEQLDAVRQNQLSEIDEMNSDNCIDTAFGKEAIILIWADYMKETANNELESLYTEISNQIASLDTTLKPVNTFSNKDVASIANIDAFFELYSAVESLATRNTQNVASSELISELSKDLLLVPDSVSAAMDKLELAGSNRNLAIRKLIQELNKLTTAKGTTVVKKQKLLKKLRDELNTAIEADEQLYAIIAKLICPSISLFKVDHKDLYEDEFYSDFVTLIESSNESLVNSEDHWLTLNTIYTAFDNVIASDVKLYSLLAESNSDAFKTWLKTLDLADFKVKSMLENTSYVDILEVLKELVVLQQDLAKAKDASFFNGDFFTGEFSDKAASEQISDWTLENITSSDVISLLTELSKKVYTFENTVTVSDAYKKVYNIFETENQLLDDIRKVDISRDFYYSAPINTSLAIELNSSNRLLNTLMNPAVNYDINNVNNSFVISKLDIDYLDNGIQIARSSKLN